MKFSWTAALVVFLLTISPLSAVSIVDSNMGGAGWSPIGNLPAGMYTTDPNPPGTIEDVGISLGFDEAWLIDVGGSYEIATFFITPGTYELELAFEYSAWKAVNNLVIASLDDLNNWQTIVPGSATPGYMTSFTVGPSGGVLGITNHLGVAANSNLFNGSMVALRQSSTGRIGVAGNDDNKTIDFDDQDIGVYINKTIPEVPEPTTALLMGSALFGFALLRKRRSQK